MIKLRIIFEYLCTILYIFLNMFKPLFIIEAVLIGPKSFLIIND